MLEVHRPLGRDDEPLAVGERDAHRAVGDLRAGSQAKRRPDGHLIGRLALVQVGLDQEGANWIQIQFEALRSREPLAERLPTRNCLHPLAAAAIVRLRSRRRPCDGGALPGADPV